MIDYLWCTWHQLVALEMVPSDGPGIKGLINIFKSKLPRELVKDWENEYGEKEEKRRKKEDLTDPIPFKKPLRQLRHLNPEKFLNFCERRIKNFDNVQRNWRQSHPEKKERRRDGENPKSDNKRKDSTQAQKKEEDGGEWQKVEKKPRPQKKKVFKGKPKKTSAGQALVASDSENRQTLATTNGEKEKPKFNFYKSPKCCYCGDDHPLAKCNKYDKMPLHERWARLTQRSAESGKFCYHCFGPSHTAGHSSCKAQPCNLKLDSGDICGKRHHKSLHSNKATKSQ